MPKDKTEEQKENQDVELTQVVTETAPAYKLPNGEVVTFENYIVWLGNEIHQIKKAVA